MRFALVLGWLVVATAAGATDLVIHQRSASSIDGGPPREETVYLTADKVVTDAPTMRTIVDLDKRTITAVDKNRRTYSVMTFDQIGAQMDELKKRMADLPPEARKAMEPLLDEGPPVTATATGKTTTIAGYVANEWAIKGGPYTGSVWATDAIATPPAFQKWKSIEQGRGGMRGAGRRLGEAMQHVQGFPLRTRIETQTGGQTTILANEVLDVKEGAAPADVLKVPSGYARQAQEG